MNEIKFDIEKLTFHDKGFIYLRPCLDITLYWVGPVFEQSDGIIKFYRQSIDLIGKELKFFRTETMTKARPLKKDTLGLIPFWFQETETKRDIYMLFLESGVFPDEPSEHAFALNASPGIGYVRLILPVSFITESVSSFLDLAKNLERTVRYDFGHAGFAVNWNHLGSYKTKALEAMNSLANRYPGLDMSHPFCTKYIVSKGIKCVNWLTFLNANYCQQLGGVDELKKKLSEDINIHIGDYGLIIQAGSAPEIGDVNRRETLPIYHQVGRVLAPIRTKEHPPIFGPEGIGNREITEKWLGRFD